MKLQLFVILALVAIACSKKNNDKGDKYKSNFGSIKPVDPEDMSLFIQKVSTISELAKSELEVATFMANDLAGLTGSQLKEKLADIQKQLGEIGEKVKRILTKGKILITRSFLAGFKKERICDGISFNDLEKKVLKGAFDRSVEIDNIGKSDKAMICIIKNIGNLIDTYQLVSAQVQMQAMMNPPTPKCEMMQMHMYSSMYGMMSITMEDPAMQTNLAMDLSCVKTNIEYLDTFISSLAIDKSNPSFLREEMVKTMVVLESIMDEANQTIIPFEIAIHNMMYQSGSGSGYGNYGNYGTGYMGYGSGSSNYGNYGTGYMGYGSGSSNYGNYGTGYMGYGSGSSNYGNYGTGYMGYGSGSSNYGNYGTGYMGYGSGSSYSGNNYGTGFAGYGSGNNAYGSGSYNYNPSSYYSGMPPAQIKKAISSMKHSSKSKKNTANKHASKKQMHGSGMPPMPPMTGSGMPPMSPMTGSGMPPMPPMPPMTGSGMPPMPPMTGSGMPPMPPMPPMTGSGMPPMPPMTGSGMPPMPPMPPMTGSGMQPMPPMPPMTGSGMPPTKKAIRQRKIMALIKKMIHKNRMHQRTNKNN